MIHFFRKRVLPKAALLGSAILLMALASTSAFAYVQAHENIVLKGPDGNPITTASGDNNAFSMKQTCFGTSGCHGDAEATNVLAYDYNDIERHSYHAQLAANDQYGWNASNPDGDKWEKGPGPKGKNWVQGQGHAGAW